MLAPRLLETPNQAAVQNTDLLFVKSFSPEINIGEAAHAMSDTFHAAANLANVVTQLTTHEHETIEPSLGILDQHFSLTSSDGTVRMHDVRVAPMGVVSGLLVGAFRPTRLGLKGAEDPLNLLAGKSPGD